MQELKKLSIALLAAVPGAISLHGCAPMKSRAPTHGPVDCRSCHKSGGTTDAKDFSEIYAKPASHHAVGIKYLAAKPGFNSPNGHGGDIAFFDRNGNGQPDSDEIQLFGEKGGVATIECSTCHKEHGDTPAPVNATPKHYLRFDNTGSALCVTCHGY